MSAQGTIFWMYGPDGAGKTTLFEELQEHDDLSGGAFFNGVHPETWPDQTFHNELIAEGIDDRTYRDSDHYRRKVERCYRMAGELAATHGFVVIDSDPRAKTAIAAYCDAERRDVEGGVELLRTYEELATIIGGTAAGEAQQVGMHVTIDAPCSAKKKGAILQQRIEERDGRSIFDPCHVEDSALQVKGATRLESTLGFPAIDVPSIHVDNYQPFDVDLVVKSMARYL